MVGRGENWSMGLGATANCSNSKACESCRTAAASLFCRADSAFLCMACDAKIHAANKLASRHARVWMCEVCEQAPATVTCKADAAALCVACDRDIHSANPLARRHERFPVVPFYDSAAAVKSAAVNGGDDGYFSDPEAGEEEEEEVEAASWLLSNPNPNHKMSNHNNNNNSPTSPDLKSCGDYNLMNEMDSYFDLDIMNGADDDHKPSAAAAAVDKYNSNYNADGVVPTQPATAAMVDGFPAYDFDFLSGSKQPPPPPPFMYNFTSQSISQSVSSSSMEVGLVPDHNALTDVSNNISQHAITETLPNPITGLDREARVLRYREKRKNRKFEKTIRYASRKAYAETRPRVKGRFAKRSEIDVEALIAADAYGVVPSY